MNEQDQIKALAQMAGLRGAWHVVEPNIHTFPKYLTSYDAIIPLIQKQPMEIRDRIATKGGPISFMVSPAQLGEKLLRAKGKWVE